MDGERKETTDYDVVVIGGAFSGSSQALLLRRWHPDARVLVIETLPKFKRKVGEATVEISGLFLSQVLRLHDILSRDHLSKMGLRFWFSDGAGRNLNEMSEVGTIHIPAMPSYQLDRAKLDESLLALCEEEGTEVARPAKVVNVESSWPSSRVTYECEGEERTVSTRWVVDASGRRCYLGKQFDLIERFDDHPTAATWGRWSGVLDMDGPGVLDPDPRGRDSLGSLPAARRLSTNHFMGRGWWCWVIPLANGDTSLGLVRDKRHFDFPGEGSKRERYESFLRETDGLRELLAGAELDADDFQSYEHLAYRSKQYMDRGWALVGDAAAFLDPYYSPGLDHCAFSVFSTATMIEKDLKGELEGERLNDAITEHNRGFIRSYPTYFDALYRDKYEIFGDAELTSIAFKLDTAMYFVGLVHDPFEDVENLLFPPFSRDDWKTRTAARIMSFTRRRLTHIARKRIERGTYGRKNVGNRDLFSGFGEAQRTITPAHRDGLRMWVRVELGELWESAFGATKAR